MRGRTWPLSSKPGDSEMTEQAWQRELRDAGEAALSEEARAERYRRTQNGGSNGRPAATDRPHPLEFDESGFPIRQRNPSFVTRVARLLSP
jgi:hypothetical protein